jgi:cell shape-determining protein MreD
VVGLALDALAPTAFGSGALAGTVIGFLAGWVKALVFADNFLMTSLFVLLAAWLRDAIQTAAANQLSGGAMGWQLLVYSPLAALTTAVAALAVLLVFRQWLGLRAAA